MTQAKPNRAQRVHMNGYEPGSLASRMSVKQRRQMEAWLKRKRQDAQVYERQLSRQN